MNREYETVYILKPDLPADRLTRVSEKVNKIIKEQGGEVLLEKDWGKRKLAYLIAKGAFGHYFLFNYQGNGAFIGDLERTLKYEEDVLRFLTIKLDPRKVALAKNKVSAIEEGKLKNEDLKVRDYEDRGRHRDRDRDHSREQHAKVETKAPATEASETVTESVEGDKNA